MSTVIKRSHSFLFAKIADLRPPDLSVIETDERSALERSAQILEQATREAEIIVRSARGEAKSIHQQAYEEGYRAGAAEAVQNISSLTEKLEDDVKNIGQDRQAVLDGIEPAVLKLCMETVEKIIRHEIKTDPRIVVRAIKSCLRRVKDSSEVYVRVSSKEIAEVRALRDELMEAAEGVHGINIQDDRRISPGGCVVESATGDFDARIETQMDRVNKKITEIYGDDRYQADSGPDKI